MLGKTNSLGTFVTTAKTELSFIPKGVWISGAPFLWKQGYTGKNVKVGIIDSGIDPSHPDLKNVKKHMNFVSKKGAYDKLHPHGTHIAGTIGANGNIKGIAPNAILYDYRIFDANGETEDETLLKAIKQGIKDRCDILNLSLGGTENSPKIKEAITLACKNNILVVVASGNESENKNWDDVVVSYPANYRSVMAVAAVNYNPQTGKIEISQTKFSNRNPAVDACADGYMVLSTFPMSDGGYGVLSGTSMACANVSGFAALLLSKAKHVLKDTGYKANNLYSLVKAFTVPIDVGKYEGSDPITDNITGDGIVSAFPDIPARISELEWLLSIKTDSTSVF